MTLNSDETRDERSANNNIGDTTMKTWMHEWNAQNKPVWMLIMFVASMVLAVVVPSYGQVTPEGIVVLDLDWSADGSLLAYATGRLLPPWSSNSCATQQTSSVKVFRNDNSIFELRDNCSYYDVDVNNLSALVTIKIVYLYDVQSGQLLSSYGGDGISYRSGSWNGTNTRILLGSVVHVDAFDVNDVYSGSTFFTGSLPGFSEDAQLLENVWAPDDVRVASSTTSGVVYVWNSSTESGTLETTFTGHAAAVQHLVWNRATGLIASGDDAGTIFVWNPATGAPVMQLVGHSGAILALDWRSDGQQLVSAGQDGTLRTWAWPSGAMQVVSTGPLVTALAYSPDGTTLAYGGEVADPNNVVIQRVPVQALVPPTPTLTPTPPPTPTPVPVISRTGTGLRGQSFGETTLSSTRFFHLNPTVNFDWGGGSPAPGAIPNDNVSIRWTGQREAPSSRQNKRPTP